MRLPFFRRIKRPLPWLIGLGIAGMIGVGAISFTVSNKDPDYDLEALTIPVIAGELTVRITASGNVEPIRTVNLSPKSAGIVRELLVEQGDRISQGQLIARMDNDQLNAQIIQNQASVNEARAQLDDALNGASNTDIGQAEAAVELARAQLQDARARLSLSEDERDRTQQLFDRGAISCDQI